MKATEKLKKDIKILESKLAKSIKELTKEFIEKHGECDIDIERLVTYHSGSLDHQIKLKEDINVEITIRP